LAVAGGNSRMSALFVIIIADNNQYAQSRVFLQFLPRFLLVFLCFSTYHV
jgi:hypothetical protein